MNTAKEVKQHILDYYGKHLQIDYGKLACHLMNGNIDRGIQTRGHNGFDSPQNEILPCIFYYSDKSILIIHHFGLIAAQE